MSSTVEGNLIQGSAKEPHALIPRIQYASVTNCKTPWAMETVTGTEIWDQ